MTTGDETPDVGSPAETFTLTRASLERIYWSGFLSGSVMTATNGAGADLDTATTFARKQVAWAEGVMGDDVWRGVLACVSEVRFPPVVKLVPAECSGCPGCSK